MTKYLAGMACLIATVAIAAGDDAQVEPSYEAQTQVFKDCDSLGRRAVDLARFYWLSNRDAAELELRAMGDPQNELWAEELLAAGNEPPHYAFFAADKLYACFAENDIPLTKPLDRGAACYILLDLPYALYNLKKSGHSKREARKYVEKKLHDRKYFPKKAIKKATNRIFRDGSESIRGYIEGNLYWGCYYDEEWY